MNTTPQQPNYDPEVDPENNLRADLWHTMNVSQLSRQQEIVIDRINKLHSMMGSGGNVSIRNMYGSLQVAMKDLSNLIDYRSQQKPR